MKINIEPNLISSESHLFSFPYKQFANSSLFIQLLEIPLLQRDYTWSDDQINDLIDDLDDYLTSPNVAQPNDRYFEGTILLEQGDANSNKYYIIDGQQRITTVYLFVFLGYLCSKHRAVHIPPGLQGNARAKAFIKRVEKFIDFEKKLLLPLSSNNNLDPLLDPAYDNMTESDQNTLFETRLGLNNYSTVYWNDYILRLASSDTQINSSLQNFIKFTSFKSNFELTNPLSEESQYFKNLSILFERMLSNNNTGNKDKDLGSIIELIDKYLDKCGFNCVISENRDDSFTLFEILNDRGADLTALDLIKNEILKRFGNNIPHNFIINWDTLKNNLTSVYGKDAKKLSAQFVNDITRSEGSDESRRYFTYLSLSGQNQPTHKPLRHIFFRTENNENFSRRLIQTSELLKILKQQNNSFDSSISGSCFQYTKLMSFLKFHWGVQTILGANIIYLKYSNYINTLNYTTAGISPWRVTQTKMNTFYQEHFLRFLGDIMLKAGIIGLTLDLQTKVLPTFSRIIGNKMIDFCYSVQNPSGSDFSTHINDIRNEFQNTFLVQGNINLFENKVKAFSYNNSKERSLIKVVLYLIYNSGAVYRYSDPELEHLEPSNPVGGTNPYFQDPNKSNIINGIGNMFLLDKTDNTIIARNKPIVQKVLDLQATGKATYNHDLFKHIDPDQNPVNSIIYGALPIISKGSSATDSFSSTNIPTRNFFEVRASMYSNIAKDKFCNNSAFINGSGQYL